MRLTSRLSGFTIIEVMITLAISGVMFVTAIGLFSSQTGETQFSQTMQDLNSEITAKLKEVGTNLSGSYQQYSCTVNPAGSPPRAVLSAGSTNSDCLYLGKAISAPQGSTSLYIYTVLGNRQTYQGGSSTGIVESFADTNPVPAITSPYNLTETYNLRSAKVKTSQINKSNDTSKYYLVGFYTDLQGGVTYSTDNNPHLITKAYSIGTAPGKNDADVNNCIIRTDNTIAGNCPLSPVDATVWTLCLADTGSSRTARLDVNNSTSGITTNLQFNVQCP